VNYGGNKPEIVLAQHEKIAVQIAHGYAKATGRPMAAIAHDTVGLLHATNAIYYAYLDRAPVIVMGARGPMDTTRRRPHIDWIHTTVLQGQAVRDYVKWDRQPVNAQEVIDSFARAYRVAMHESQGPVYLCYDAAFQEDPQILHQATSILLWHRLARPDHVCLHPQPGRRDHAASEHENQPGDASQEYCPLSGRHCHRGRMHVHLVLAG